jgi:hypothetical protein
MEVSPSQATSTALGTAFTLRADPNETESALKAAEPLRGMLGKLEALLNEHIDTVSYIVLYPNSKDLDPQILQEKRVTFPGEKIPPGALSNEAIKFERHYGGSGEIVNFTITPLQYERNDHETPGHPQTSVLGLGIINNTSGQFAVKTPQSAEYSEIRLQDLVKMVREEILTQVINRPETSFIKTPFKAKDPSNSRAILTKKVDEIVEAFLAKHPGPALNSEMPGGTTQG